ncbi:uncharacterized protein LOC128919893 [Zeugodacus cucurbitae]|uniref:uncharacterized protein LOC128919893 n=1 Tax=Zeugodacus cucurbitae TaxID=28588 RepID=UPI0023D93D47|nr:uncharacterized protein LOC128919893 [Zeugodacus cucurbitae]
MSAAQPDQQSRRHSLNAYFSFVEPAKPTNKKGNGEKDDPSQRPTEPKQSLQTAKSAENGSQQGPATNKNTPTNSQVPANDQTAKKNIAQEQYGRRNGITINANHAFGCSHSALWSYPNRSTPDHHFNRRTSANDRHHRANGPGQWLGINTSITRTTSGSAAYSMPTMSPPASAIALRNF